MHTLFSIRARKDCISVNELAKNTRVTPGAVTQFVNALVKKGLVSREIDPGDRRIVRLHLTELAKKQFEKFKEEQMSVMSRIFEVLSDEEIKQLIAIFTKLNTVHSARNHIDVETHKTPRTV
jgi:DNA-binding MarR family transcriptional regulator